MPLPGVTTELADIDALLDEVVAELGGTASPNVEPKVEHAPQNGELSDKDFVIWLEDTLSPDQVALITKGIWKGEKVPDRSAQFYHAVCWLKDSGWSLADILRLFRKYPNGIADKYLNDAGGSDERLAGQIKTCFNRAKEKVRDEAKGADDERIDADINNIILTAAALENLPPPTEWKYCNYIGRAAHSATNGAVEGFRAWYGWIARAGKTPQNINDFGHAQKEWLDYFNSPPPNEIGLATLLDLADRANSNWRDKLSEEFWQRVVSS
jgi:hypothetical protein